MQTSFFTKLNLKAKDNIRSLSEKFAKRNMPDRSLLNDKDAAEARKRRTKKAEKKKKKKKRRSIYAHQLRDPRWQRLRLLIFNRDFWQCKKCFDDKKTLVVHHKYYLPGIPPWAYPYDCYLTLCVDCHRLTHGCAKK